jgi:hypothetical protein
MKCGFLKGKVRCDATVGEFIPSSFEIQEYCRTRRHKVCPFYFRKKRTENTVGASSKESVVQLQ